MSSNDLVDGLSSICRLVETIVTSAERVERARLHREAVALQCQRDIRMAELALDALRVQCRTGSSRFLGEPVFEAV